jgi:hypothetical protein
MLSLAWVELDTLTSEIRRLQIRRSIAKAKDDFDLANAIADALDHAMRARDDLVSHIMSQIGEGALAEAIPAKTRAA